MNKSDLIESDDDEAQQAMSNDLDDFKLPEMDWDSLEAKLKQANQEATIQSQRVNMNTGTDREEIRRKLASTVVSSSSSISSSYEPGHESGSLATGGGALSHVKPGHNLQICFMNDPSVLDEGDEDDANGDEEYDEFPLDHSSDGDDLPVKEKTVAKKNVNHVPISLSNFSMDFICNNESWNTILAQLQYETKQLMANVPSQVRLRVEAEIASSKKVSPIADIVGLPTYGLKKLERSHLVDMNIGQLQVIVNDLCNQIENINEELKMMLVDRDDYYMQQDSLLVEVEDLIKRIHEFEAKHKAEKKSKSPTTKSTESEKQNGGRISFSSSIQEIAGKASAYLPNGSNLMAKGSSSSSKAASRFFQLFQQKTNK